MQLSGNTLAHLAELEAAQWQSWSTLRGQQHARLAALLEFAHRHVPYYRRQMVTSGLISATGALQLDRFVHLPCLDKQTIRRHQTDLLADDLSQRRWWHDATGGSTGEPLQFVTDHAHHEWRQAVRHLFDRWTGYVIGEPRMVLWGAARDHVTWHALFHTSPLPRYQSWRTYLARRVKQEYWVNTWRLTPQELDACVAYISRTRPQHILAYAESIYEVARTLEQRGVRLPPLKAVMTSASTLYPHMRRLIARIFQCAVFDRYGSRELGDIACECGEHNGLHISPLTHYVEILNHQGEVVQGDEVGEIVVTSLTNRAMPLIRYRTGDYGRWLTPAPDDPQTHVCGCGLAWPRLAAIEGRVQDTLLTPTGTWISSAAVNRIFAQEAWVLRYQVVQPDFNRLLVYLQLATSQPARPDDLARLRAALQTLLGVECTIHLEVVAAIAATPNGKHRPVYSQLDPNQTNPTAGQ